jgi:hypothetical protein
VDFVLDRRWQSVIREQTKMARKRAGPALLRDLRLQGAGTAFSKGAGSAPICPRKVANIP